MVVGFSSDAEKLINAFNWPGNVRQLENVIHCAVVMSNGPLITDKCLAQTLGIPLEKLNEKLKRKASSNAPEDTMQHISSYVQPSILIEVDEHKPLSTLYEHDIVPLSRVEEHAIKQAIEYCDGNVVKAASLLEVSPSTLYRKVNAWEQK